MNLHEHAVAFAFYSDDLLVCLHSDIFTSSASARILVLRFVMVFLTGMKTMSTTKTHYNHHCCTSCQPHRIPRPPGVVHSVPLCRKLGRGCSRRGHSHNPHRNNTCDFQGADHTSGSRNDHWHTGYETSKTFRTTVVVRKHLNSCLWLVQVGRDKDRSGTRGACCTLRCYPMVDNTRCGKSRRSSPDRIGSRRNRVSRRGLQEEVGLQPRRPAPSPPPPAELP